MSIYVLVSQYALACETLCTRELSVDGTLLVVLTWFRSLEWALLIMWKRR